MATPNSSISTYDSTDYRTRLANISTPISSNMASPVISSPLVPVTQPKVVAPATAPIAPTSGAYTIKAGDSLSVIAQRNGMSLSQLLALNPTYQANPNLVKIGASINLSGASAPATPATQTPPMNTTIAPVNTNNDLGARVGQAGLSPDQYNTIISSNNSVTQQESDAIARELGIPTVEGELFKKPSQTSEQIYQSAYSASGLGDIKAKIQTINDEIAKDRADLTSATGKIDENPFLSETSRVGRGRILLDQAEKKINNKLSTITQYQNLYNQGLKEIEGLVTRNQNDFSTDQAINTAKLNYLQKKAEVQVANLKSKKISDNTSMSSYLDGLTGSKAPQTIGSADTGFYTYDPITKKFVQSVAPKPKTGTGTGTGTTTKITRASVLGDINSLIADKASIGGVPVIDPNGYITPQAFETMVQVAAQAGVKRDELFQIYKGKMYNQQGDYSAYGIDL